MIFLSLLCKTLALSLLGPQPWLAAALWLAGLAADVLIARKNAGSGGMAGRLLLLQACSLAAGLAVGFAGDYAGMRWKDGIPVFAALTGGALNLVGMPAGSHGGVVHLSTMAGPLEFAASIDALALKVPLLFLAMAAVRLLADETQVREALRRLAIIAGILCAAAVLRLACVILLANSLFEFVGYESEELPWRPFMDEAAGIWLHAPFLLAAGALIGRFLPAPAEPAARTPLPAWFRRAAAPVMLLLPLLVFVEPAGEAKQGKLVISTHHTQWSRCDRPYDREWYGAESGYNYACLRRLFEKFMPVVEAKGPLAAGDLEGASVLVIYDPDTRFSKDEIGLVHEFVRNGGGLLLIGDHTNVFGSASHLNEVCAPFGFQFRDDVLFDLDEDFHQLLDAPWPGSAFWHGMSFFKLRGPASIRPTSIWTRPVYQVGHSKSVRAIYSVNNFYPPPHDDPKMRHGTFCVAAAARHGGGRVAAWGDSTVFSNFEIFYPGKQEYLLNTLGWLNRKDGVLPSVGRRLALAALLAGVAAVLLWRREPRVWLVTLSSLAASLGVAWLAGRVIESGRAAFPDPQEACDWVVFAADPKDRGHNLRDFVSEEPYNERYEVFIQWVMRTGSFAGFHLLGTDQADGLHAHLRNSDRTKVANALIVRKPGDLGQLGEFAAIPRRPQDPVLLMFASAIPAEQALEVIERAGIATKPESLAEIRKAWPAGEAVIDDGGRRLMVVAGAERFSDQAMGISEKVIPDETQKALFNQAFGIIDRLLGRNSE
jgi:hypothetical protein